MRRKIDNKNYYETYFIGSVTGDGIGVDCKSTASLHGEFESLTAHKSSQPR